MAEKGTHGTTRSFGLWILGGAVLCLAAIVIFENLDQGELSTDERAAISAESKPPHRNAGLGQSLLKAHQSSVSAANSKVTASEEALSEIVGSGRPAQEITTDLLELFPESKGSEQTLVASHLSHLAEGEQLEKLVSYLSDPRINKQAKEEIFNAIYESEPKQAASLLIQVIEAGVQEYAEESQKTLSILLQADHGTDVAAWKAELGRFESSLQDDDNEQ